MALCSSRADWQAVLLRGPSGSGKSDLALRLLHQFGGEQVQFIADDYVHLAVQQGRFIVSSPDTIKGKMEVRGVGIVDVPSCESAPLALAVDLVSAVDVPRLPQADRWQPERDVTIDVPVFKLAPFEASTPAKVLVLFEEVCRNGETWRNMR